VTLEKIHEPAKPMEKPVEKIGKVTVVGAVGKGGSVDLEKGMRLRKAIDSAGGAAKDADLAAVRVYHSNMTSTIVDLSKPERVLDAAHNIELVDGDSIEVPALPGKVDLPPADIEGQVINPGSYDAKEGLTLVGLITLAGKLTPLADVQKVQVQHAGKKEFEIVNLEERAKLGIPGDYYVKPGDHVFVPPVTDSVTVLGMVKKEGHYSFHPGERVSDFFEAGRDELAGATNDALVDLKGVELIRNGEKPRKLPLKEILKNPSHKDNVQLAAGDILYLPSKRQHTGGIMEKIQQFTPLATLFAVF